MKRSLASIIFLFNSIIFSDILHDDAFIPISAYTPGAYDTFWQSDLCILNADSKEHKVNLHFYSNDSSYEKEKEIFLEASESQCISNIVETFFYYEGYGSIYIEADEFFAPIGVISRTYTKREDGGTYGQTIDDQIFNLSTKISYIPGIKRNENFRTNIGVAVYSSPYSENIFNIEIYDHKTLKKTYSIKVKSKGVVQVPLDVDVDCGFAKFIPEEEKVVYLGYISVVDNTTGDAIFIPSKDKYEESK